MKKLEELIAEENRLIGEAFSAGRGSLDECASLAHAEYINQMIDAWTSIKIGQPGLRKPLIGVDADDIPDFCDQLHDAFLNSTFECELHGIQRSRSKKNLAENGAVYTPTGIAFKISHKAIYFYEGERIPDVLDFACGTGRFYEGALCALRSRYQKSPDELILDHLFALDTDPVSISIARLKALSMLKHPSLEKAKMISERIICKNALIENDCLLPLDNALLSSDFGGRVKKGFDVILSNPPYLVLKPTKRSSGGYADRIASLAAYFRSCGRYPLSTEGMLNLYQLSIEKMLGMLRSGGEMGVICPSTLFADSSAARLRTHLIQNNQIREIAYFPEKAALFDNITQATTIFYLKKSGKTSDILIQDGEKRIKVKFDAVKALFPQKLEVPFLSEIEWTILEKLSKFTKLKNLPGIRNRRGELDLSLFRRFITTKPTPYRLVRGNMIGEKGIADTAHEYVDETFLTQKSDDFLKHDFRHERIACQQVSNAGQRRRLRFAWCKTGDILGNSCNYISGDHEILSKLMTLLNSSLLNWRFKATSTNNHINNYELDELPVANLDAMEPIQEFSSQTELDQYVGKLYGLTNAEIEHVSVR